MFHHHIESSVLEHSPRPVETALLTLAALFAFASNSILCRLALGDRLIDPALFAAVRLGSGALILSVLCAVRGENILPRVRDHLLPGFLLFLYAIPFTFAYLELPAGTGALILFGAVQITMMLASLRMGHRPAAVEWTGLAVAFAGLVWLVAPGVHAPSPGSSALMALAGAAWGLYTMRGRRSGSPLADTGGNFVLAALPSLVIAGVGLPGSTWHPDGIWLGVASGALASGLGYAIWYRALRGLTPVRAAVVQLGVPVLAGVGGVVVLSEAASPRLLIGGATVLGGIGLTIIGQRYRQQ